MGRSLKVFVLSIAAVFLVAVAKFFHPLFYLKQLFKPPATTASINQLRLDDIPPEYQGKVSLFMLLGQSNMSGVGRVIFKKEVLNPHIFIWQNRWEGAKDSVEAQPGPGLSFAKELVRLFPNMVIGLIPCARPSTSISEWLKNSSQDDLYNNCLKKVNQNLRIGTVSGVLVYQGESDAQKNYEEAAVWGNRFGMLINDLRSDLHDPNLPVIFAQLDKTTSPSLYPNFEVIKQQQSLINQVAVKMITTDDLDLRDEIHLTDEGYQILGKRFALGYSSLLSSFRDIMNQQK